MIGSHRESRHFFKHRRKRLGALTFCYVLASYAPTGRCTIVTGRFTVGTYAAKESFTDPSDGPSSNDVEVISSRIYLKLQRVGAFDMTFDLRDKNDFFDKMDAERLHLTGSNSFQAREANIKYPNRNGGFYSTLGRFSLSEAGSVFTDGAELGERLGPGLRVAAFGGHNPQRPEDPFLRNDTPDVVYGTYLVYQPHMASWQRILNTSFAYVNNSVNGFTDRRYFFNNVLYQWNTTSRVISNVYLDFVPRTYVQNANLIYQQGVTRQLSTNLQYLAYDTYEYSRRTGILETLPSSPYHEGSAGTRYNIGRASQWITQFQMGQRTADKKERKEAKTGLAFNGVFSPKVDMVAYGGYRQDFTARGPSARLETNYYSAKWEFGWNLETAVEQSFATEVNTPSVLHPIMTEFSVGSVLSKALFSACSLQYARNEVVNVISVYLNLTYRFGSKDLPPIRDGAPPRRAW